MTPELRRRVEQLLDEALDRPPEERADYLAEVCADSPEVRAEVESLLAHHEQADRADLLGQPPLGPPGSVPTAELGPVAPAAGAAAWPCLPGYEVVGELGHGAFGVVYQARQTALRRLVALKMIRAGAHAGPDQFARFRVEAEAVARLCHPHIVQIHEVSEHAGLPYCALEYVEGGSLAAKLAGTPQPAAPAARLVELLARAMHHAHGRGIVHRDLKPSNILLAGSDRPQAVRLGSDPEAARPYEPKVTDFGLAKLVAGGGASPTHTGEVMGTPSYMAPEQATGRTREVGPAADVYALGAILYELLTGRPPFKGATPLETLRQVVSEEPVPPRRLQPKVPRDLETICLECLEKEPGKRYASAEALADDLGRFSRGEPIRARPSRLWERGVKWARRRPAVAGLLLALGAVVSGGVAGLTALWLQAEGARDAAQAAEANERDQRRLADAAREAAQKRLAQVEKGNEILASVFRDLDPKAEEKGGKELRVLLGERLGEAVRQLEGEAVGDPEAVARVQLWLGQSLLGLGHLDQAQVVLEKARQTFETLLGPDHLDALHTMSNLAVVYKARGRYDDAESLAKQVLEGYRYKLGPDALNTLNSMNNLAVLYLQRSRDDDAEPLFKQVLEASHDKLGPDHRLRLASMSSLGALYRKRGRYDDAELLLKQALEASRRKLGPDHPHTLTSMGNLANLYITRGRYDAAEPLRKQALEASRRKLGPDHPDTLTSMNDLAALYWSMKKLDRSIPLFEECLKLQKAKLGSDHSDTVLTLANLGVNYSDAGRLEEGMRCLDEAVAAWRKRPGPLHPGAAWIPRALAAAYDRANQFAKSEPLYREFLEQARQQFGPDDVRTAGALAQLGWNLLRQKKAADAEPLLRACLAIREKNEPEEWTTFNAKALLGGALLGQKKYAEAEPLLLAGYEGLKQRAATIPADGKIHLTEALERLVQL